MEERKEKLKKLLYEYRFTFPQFKDFMEKYNISLPKHAEPFEIETEDKKWVDFYAEIAKKTVYDDEEGEQRTPEQKRRDNFYGLLGEKAIKDKLRIMRIIHYWNEREPKFKEKSIKSPLISLYPKQMAHISLWKSKQ